MRRWPCVDWRARLRHVPLPLVIPSRPQSTSSNDLTEPLSRRSGSVRQKQNERRAAPGARARARVPSHGRDSEADEKKTKAAFARGGRAGGGRRRCGVGRVRGATRPDGSVGAGASATPGVLFLPPSLRGGLHGLCCRAPQLWTPRLVARPGAVRSRRRLAGAGCSRPGRCVIALVKSAALCAPIPAAFHAVSPDRDDTHSSPPPLHSRPPAEKRCPAFGDAGRWETGGKGGGVGRVDPGRGPRLFPPARRPGHVPPRPPGVSPDRRFPASQSSPSPPPDSRSRRKEDWRRKKQMQRKDRPPDTRGRHEAASERA